ncbi:hypothetical protein FRC12_008290 [Ceratobasidium sp. 428]|nr:hypothetical protein FRC12_008290 [Ceratobasidium sp. 428]
MFPIDVNAISKKNRFTIPPLGPIGKSTGFLESALDTDVSVKSLSSVSDDVGDTSEDALSDRELPDLWTTKPDRGIAQNLAFSWDAPVRGPATRSAFLSEQPARVFVASRYHVQPRLESVSTTTRRFISPSDLLTSLRTTLLGGTSLLFGWDEANAQFVVRSEKPEDDSENTVLILGELSEETTMSLVEPLLCIGGLLRRLDGIVAKLQSSSAIPTARALAYALQSIIELIQTDLTARLPLNLAIIALARLSVIFGDIRYELDALAELCLCVSTSAF